MIATNILNGRVRKYLNHDLITLGRWQISCNTYNVRGVRCGMKAFTYNQIKWLHFLGFLDCTIINRLDASLARSLCKLLHLGAIHVRRRCDVEYGFRIHAVE